MLDCPETVARVGVQLRRAGFTTEGVRGVLGGDSHFSTRRLKTRLAQVPATSTLATLIRLLIVGDGVLLEDAASAFSPVRLEDIASIGFLDPIDGDWVRSRVRLIPLGDLLVACDREPLKGFPPDGQYVAGIHASSVQMAHLTIRLPMRTALDLGTGCGVQSMLLAQHCERVTGTDINPRALDYAAFSAQLNDIRNISWLQGDRFEPLSEQKFDMIICDPPYVISPESDRLFRDNGLAGDTFCRSLVEGAPRFLVEGGVATLLASWVIPRGEPWWVPVASWVKNNDCDCILFHIGSVSPIANAKFWIGDLDQAEPTDVSSESVENNLARIEMWLDYYHQLGADAIAYGAIVLRHRPAAKNWLRRVELTNGVPRNASRELLRILHSNA